jgi:hypothetical protein
MEELVMDRRQLVVQRTRDYFGDRLDDVLAMIRQDRQELRGWQEPAHVRAVIRRAVREGGNGETATTTATVTLMPPEFGRAAAEPDRGLQREATGQLLEAGASALEKLVRNAMPEITAEEMLGLECVLLLYGRPALAVDEGRLASVPPFWNLLEDQREDVEMVQRGVGRLELLGHPEYDWAGSAFLVTETALVTTRRLAEIFAENRSGNWQFRPGITAWMDYRSPYQGVANAGYRIRGVLGVHDQYDLGLLEVEPPQTNGRSPVPLVLAASAPPRLEGRPVYLVGFPVQDARRNEPERIARIFREVYNVKRVQPGLLRGLLQFRDVHLLQHDCAPLGLTGGSCLVDLETHQVIGLQLSGRYLEMGTAIPLWVLREDPLMRKAGVTFAETTNQERETVANQLERLARSRYWTEARAVIGQLYQRAFGKSDQ